MKNFSHFFWMKMKLPQLGGKSYIDLAKESLEKKEKISSYHPKLLKLAKILNQLGGDNFKSEIFELKKLTASY